MMFVIWAVLGLTGTHSGGFVDILLNGNISEIYKIEKPREAIIRSMNVFNKIKLTRYQKAVIWDVFKGDTEPQNLTSDDLNKVIYLLPAIPEDDLSNLNTSDWKIVEILGRIRGFSRSQISVIANSLRFKWDRKTLTKADYINKYSGLICGFPEDELAIIPKIEFRKINSSVFTNLFTCSENQFRILHDQVIKVYGIPQSWSEKLITHIGMIILSLTKNEIRSLRPSVLQGLDIGLIATFKPEILDFFTSEQLRSLNPPKIVTKSGSGRTSVPEIWLFPLYLLLKC